MALSQTIVYEQGDLVYLIAPVTPITPSTEQIEEWAYGRSVVAEAQKRAPNPVLAWFGGHYVEADKANGNGAMWTAKEIALKALTPLFMPVTVMHDPSAVVGLIADLALQTPDKDQVPRARIETALALWEHRFPHVVEEARLNYELGTLMQSMECLAPQYDCAECGQHYHKLPGGAEQANWCEHLKRETGVRILAATTFTGTGLIFGSRGAKGADPMAHLEEFTAEVAEFHQKKRHDDEHRTPPKTTSGAKYTMDIEQAKYEELIARPTREELAAVVAERDRAVREQETAETENVSLKSKVEEQETALKTASEEKAQQGLRAERVAKLGAGFVAKLGEKTRARLEEQAKVMEDSDWAARLEELAELTGIAHDAPADSTAPAPAGDAAAAAAAAAAAGSQTPILSAEETAKLTLRSGDQGAAPSVLTPSTVAGLFTKSNKPSLKS